MPATPLLELTAVSTGYDGREILHNVSYRIDAGSFIGVIGPNGAGKTTLFKTITGLLKPWAGAVLYAGNNRYTAHPMALAKEIATMPQTLDYSFPFTVEEFVLMGRFPHLKRLENPKAKDHQIVDESIRQADIDHLRQRRITELSGGERQLALLAQALAQQPRLLLLDEPTAHLDIGHQVTILNTIRRLNQSNGITVIAVLHDLNLAAEYSDQLLMLNAGSVYATGTPQDVLTYQNIEAVYKTVVLVKDNPLSHKPYIILVSGEHTT
jgi:iron complex transport system ATP-binding protein